MPQFFLRRNDLSKHWMVLSTTGFRVGLICKVKYWISFFSRTLLLSPACRRIDQCLRVWARTERELLAPLYHLTVTSYTYISTHCMYLHRLNIHLICVLLVLSAPSFFFPTAVWRLIWLSRDQIPYWPTRPGELRAALFLTWVDCFNVNTAWIYLKTGCEGWP